MVPPDYPCPPITPDYWRRQRTVGKATDRPVSMSPFIRLTTTVDAGTIPPVVISASGALLSVG